MKKASRKERENLYSKRRRQVLLQIRGDAALFFSAPDVYRSRDQKYVFRQNSDLFYLSGLDEPDCALLLLGNTKGPRSIVFLKERDEQKEKWEKGPIGLSLARRRMLVDEVRPFESLTESLPELSSFASRLHYTPGNHPLADELVWNLLKLNSGPRIDRPHILQDARLITSEMRVKKDKEEIRTLKHACDLTAEAFRRFTMRLPEYKSELHAARILESEFCALGGDSPAFHTIVAAGKNATVLHHSPTFQPLWKKELVLVDAGSNFNGYAADMTRTLPVSGTFSSIQAEVYDAVLEAFKAGCEKASAGNSLDDIHRTTLVCICKGLVSIGVLKGKPSTLVRKKSYMPYFMHRTGHWLGIDVHDIAPCYYQGKRIDPYRRPMEAGSFITIEPGLYFDPKDKSVIPELRGIGVRIEDSVQITANGSILLTDRMPKERNEIEQLMSSSQK